MPGIYTIGRIEAAVNQNVTFATRHILAQDQPKIEMVEKEFAETRKSISGLFEEYEKSVRALGPRMMRVPRAGRPSWQNPPGVPSRLQ